MALGDMEAIVLGDGPGAVEVGQGVGEEVDDGGFAAEDPQPGGGVGWEESGMGEL